MLQFVVQLHIGGATQPDFSGEAGVVLSAFMRGLSAQILRSAAPPA
jgi:hypothetical protein